MKRYYILGCALLMQICLGATYAWPVFVRPLRELTGLGQGPAQLPFTVFYFAFPATMVLAGWLLPKIGPRRSAVLGGLLFGGGWMLASGGSTHVALTVLGIGLVAGVGVGFAYIVPIAVCVRWFPNQKGLVTGIAVAGFGGGAALIGQIGNALTLLSTPFTAFALLGAAFFLLVPAAGLTMQFPPLATPLQPNPGPARLSPARVLESREFLLLYGAMSAGLAAGFAVNANLKQLSTTAAGTAGVAAVALFAVGNAAGRLAWGFAFDRLRLPPALASNLVLQAIVLLSSFWLLGTGAGFLAFAFLTGLNYGGVLVLYASSTARIWGAENVGQVYGLLFSSNIVAAPVPVLTGLIYDATGSFSLSLTFVAVLMLAAALWISLRPPLTEPPPH
ncbi:MAG TPA: MFS transporter [Bacteroidota bacterium]